MKCVCASVLRSSLQSLSLPRCLPASLSAAGPEARDTAPATLRDDDLVDTSLRDRFTLTELDFWSFDLELVLEGWAPVFTGDTATHSIIMHQTCKTLRRCPHLSTYCHRMSGRTWPKQKRHPTLGTFGKTLPDQPTAYTCCVEDRAVMEIYIQQESASELTCRHHQLTLLPSYGPELVVSILDTPSLRPSP